MPDRRARVDEIARFGHVRADDRGRARIAQDLLRRPQAPRLSSRSVAAGLAQIVEWRANVAELATDSCVRWDLQARAPYRSGAAGHVVRVECADGTPAVLKVFRPHRDGSDCVETHRETVKWLLDDR